MVTVIATASVQSTASATASLVQSVIEVCSYFIDIATASVRMQLATAPHFV